MAKKRPESEGPVKELPVLPPLVPLGVPRGLVKYPRWSGGQKK